MIRRISRCPYCRTCEVAYDCHAKQIVLNPDGGSQQPCVHFLYLNATFCQCEILPDNGSRVSLASIFWHHPGLAGMNLAELYGHILELTRSPVNPDQVEDEPAFKADRIRLEDEVRLSRQEAIALLDRVGWDQVSDDRLTPMKYRMNGWIVFVADTDQFVGHIREKCATKAGARR